MIAVERELRLCASPIMSSLFLVDAKVWFRGFMEHHRPSLKDRSKENSFDLPRSISLVPVQFLDLCLSEDRPQKEDAHMKFIRHNPRAQQIDDQRESARRLQEYRDRCERTPEPIDLEEFQELPTVSRINEIFMRAPRPKR